MADKTRRGKTVTVDGIGVEVLPDLEDDYELAECSYVASDPAATQQERTRARMRMFRVILGDAHDRVMAELRSRHDGRLPAEAVIDFMNRVITSARAAKNS